MLRKDREELLTKIMNLLNEHNRNDNGFYKKVHISFMSCLFMPHKERYSVKDLIGYDVDVEVKSHLIALVDDTKKGEHTIRVFLSRMDERDYKTAFESVLENCKFI